MKPMLEGVRIVDMAQMLAGGYGSMLLGDMGAEMIKIEQIEVGIALGSWGRPLSREKLDRLFADPQAAARNMVVEMEHPTVGRLRSIGNPRKKPSMDKGPFEPPPYTASTPTRCCVRSWVFRQNASPSCGRIE